MRYTPTEEEQQEYLAYDSYHVFFERLEKGLQEIKAYPFHRRKKKVLLIAGAMVAFDKGTIDFLNEMARRSEEYQYVLLSEVTGENRRKTRDLIAFEAVCTPHLLAKEILVPHMDVPVSKKAAKYVRDRAYCREAAENLNMRHADIGHGYAQALVYYADLYLREVLRKFHPDRILLWNEFYAFHWVLRGLCREIKIPVGYMEFGCIPGTLVIEAKGQQGESYPARHPYKFGRLPVTSAEKEQAGQLLPYLYKTELNRNVQPRRTGTLERLVKKKSGRPVITYLGQNDYESGLCPYTARTKRYHSPIFKSTLEGLEYLRLLSIQNDWTLLYKPHPIVEALQKIKVLRKGNGYEYLKDVNINEVIDHSDVLVTILSQSAYLALIRGKPAVMLGYTQLRHAGCTYEAFSRRKIESQIKEAIRYGYTEKQKQRFQEHIARLLRYYLWDDRTHPDFPFGQRIEDGMAHQSMIKRGM